MESPSPPAEDSSCCPFKHCLCSWRSECSPMIPRVAPDREYVGLPAGADDSPAWSVLVGVMSGVTVSSLGLHRFRVARSGLVLGRNGDALESVVDDVDFKTKKESSSRIHAAAATQSPDGRSLSFCLFSREHDFSDPKKVDPPRPLQLHLDLGATDDYMRISVSPLPGLPIGPLMPTCPVSVAGELWAPYLTNIHGPSYLVMQRLEDGNWVEASRFHLQKGIQRDLHSNAAVLQGVTVVGRTILLSLYPPRLLFTFDCSTHSWKAVDTAPVTPYAPIHGRGVYVEKDDAIYFFHGQKIYSYKLCKNQDQQPFMAPPTVLGRVVPFWQGNGFITHLSGRMMCCVWISKKLDCGCDAEHVLITTFRVRGDDSSEHFVPKGIDILHSTCRRIDRLPSKPSETYCQFCFLQEYKEFSHDNPPPAKKRRGMQWLGAMDFPVCSNVPSTMMACCRDFFNGSSLSHAVVLESSAIQIDKALYIVCQAAKYSTVYKFNILDGILTCHDKILKSHCTMETSTCYDEDDMVNCSRPLPWHFVCDPSHIHAVGRTENEFYSCSLDEGKLLRSPLIRPGGVEVHLVLRVGIKIIALTDNLQCVYTLSQSCWMMCETSVPPHLEGKVDLSGYVVLGVDSFMVYDAKSRCCFLLDLQCNKWNIVQRSSRCQSVWPSFVPEGFSLSGRSLLVDGFIYTCSDGGLAAYELIKEGDSYYLGDKIYLKFPWDKYWERDQMCFEYIGKDKNSGAIMFCVLQDYCTFVHRYPVKTRPVSITTVQVMTEGMPDGNQKPKTIGHVDIGTCCVEWSGGVMWTSNCFAAAPF